MFLVRIHRPPAHHPQFSCRKRQLPVAVDPASQSQSSSATDDANKAEDVQVIAGQWTPDPRPRPNDQNNNSIIIMESLDYLLCHPDHHHQSSSCPVNEKSMATADQRGSHCMKETDYTHCHGPSQDHYIHYATFPVHVHLFRILHSQATVPYRALTESQSDDQQFTHLLIWTPADYRFPGEHADDPFVDHLAISQWVRRLWRLDDRRLLILECWSDALMIDLLRQSVIAMNENLYIIQSVRVEVIEEPFGMTTLQQDGSRSENTATGMPSIWPLGSLRELPICAACLRRLDVVLTGIRFPVESGLLFMDTELDCNVCSRTRLSSVKNTSISSQHGLSSSTAISHRHHTHGRPISPTGASALKCESCPIVGEENLSSSIAQVWICLVCGRVGCGRYQKGHAECHYKQSGHEYALELDTHRIWDYSSDGYVHRLIPDHRQNGQWIEIPSPADFQGSWMKQLQDVRQPPTYQQTGLSISAESFIPTFSAATDLWNTAQRPMDDIYTSNQAPNIISSQEELRENSGSVKKTTHEDLISLDSLQQRLLQLQLEHEHMASEKSTLAHQHDHVQTENDRLQSSLTEVTGQYRALLRAHHALQQQFAAQERDQCALQSQYQASQQRIMQLERQLIQSQRETEEEHALREAMQRKVDEQESCIVTLREEIGDMMGFIEGRARLEELIESGACDRAEVVDQGTLVLGKPSGSSTARGKQSNKKRRK